MASTTGFAVGDWVVVRSDATDAFIAEHSMTDLWGGLGGSLGGVMFLRQIVAVDAAASRMTIDRQSSRRRRMSWRSDSDKIRPEVSPRGGWPDLVFWIVGPD